MKYRERIAPSAASVKRVQAAARTAKPALPVRRIAAFAGAAGLIALLAGCGDKPQKSVEPVLPYVAVARTVARMHWVGRNRISESTNAAALKRVWSEPQSEKLAAQTLDKLSTAPWRLFSHAATTNSAASSALRPLIEDCFSNECHLEIRDATNQPGELAFAIRVSPEHAALWQTNLATVIESLTGMKTESRSAGWSLTKHDVPNRIDLVHVGGWVLVGIGQDTNSLLADFAARIEKSGSPVTAGNPDSWLELALDPRGVSDAFNLNWDLPANCPKILLDAGGHNQLVGTRADFLFPESLNLDLQPWRVPAGLIRPPLSSFIAVRGIESLVKSLPWWTNLPPGPAPNQLFCWALDGAPQMTFLAAPLENASNRVATIVDWAMKNYGGQFATNETFSFKKSENGNALLWNGIPFLDPTLKSEKTDDGEFVFIGMFPNRPPTRTPPPAGLLEELSTRTNLVYYDWDLTGPRIGSLLYVSQFFRFALKKPQLPEGAELAWLNATATNLGPTVTEVAQVAPNELRLLRSSGCGFTALELHLIADWLASPTFPVGLHTFTAKPPPSRGRLPMNPPEK